MKKILLSLILFLFPNIVFGAIAYDTSIQAQSVSANTLNTSITCSGTNNIIMLQVVLQYWDTTLNANGLSTVTVNGSNATRIGNQQNGTATNSNRQWLYYFSGATSGTYNITITDDGVHGAHWIAVVASCYNGVDQTSPIDSYAQGGPSTPATVTSTIDNDWGIMIGNDSLGATAPTASTGSTRRQVAFAYESFFDSNGAKTPAGTISMAMGQSTNYWTIAAIKPYTAPIVIPNFIPSLVNVFWSY